VPIRLEGNPHSITCATYKVIIARGVRRQCVPRAVENASSQVTRVSASLGDNGFLPRDVQFKSFVLWDLVVFRKDTLGGIDPELASETES
jgi:hypothetical protein